eukprot:4337188-Alexandrium_andersonii.AAC.1
MIPSGGAAPFRKMRDRLRRSKLELRGYRKDLEFGFPSCRLVHSAQLFAQMPNCLLYTSPSPRD